MGGGGATGTAVAADVATGKTFSSAAGSGLTGTSTKNATSGTDLFSPAQAQVDATKKLASQMLYFDISDCGIAGIPAGGRALLSARMHDAAGYNCNTGLDLSGNAVSFGDIESLFLALADGNGIGLSTIDITGPDMPFAPQTRVLAFTFPDESGSVYHNPVNGLYTLTFPAESGWTPMVSHVDKVITVSFVTESGLTVADRVYDWSASNYNGATVLGMNNMDFESAGVNPGDTGVQIAEKVAAWFGYFQLSAVWNTGDDFITVSIHDENYFLPTVDFPMSVGLIQDGVFAQDENPATSNYGASPQIWNSPYLLAPNGTGGSVPIYAGDSSEAIATRFAMLANATLCERGGLFGVTFECGYDSDQILGADSPLGFYTDQSPAEGYWDTSHSNYGGWWELKYYAKYLDTLMLIGISPTYGQVNNVAGATGSDIASAVANYIGSQIPGASVVGNVLYVEQSITNTDVTFSGDTPELVSAPSEGMLAMLAMGVTVLSEPSNH